MSMHDAINILGKAKDEYIRALRQVDSKLRAHVSSATDPYEAVLEAQKLQATYSSGFDSASLRVNEQPAAPPPPPMADHEVPPAEEPSVTTTEATSADLTTTPGISRTRRSGKSQE